MRSGIKIFTLFVFITFVGCTGDDSDSTREIPLIPRQKLMGNPEVAAVRISPDGEYISYLAPSNGKLNVWVALSSDPASAKAVTNDTLRGIRIYQWTYKKDHLLYSQDIGGDENWSVFLVNVATGEENNLTPFDEIPGPDGLPMKLPDGKIMRPRATILSVSNDQPNEILIRLNKDNARYQDVYKVNLESKQLTKFITDEDYLQILMDDNYIPLVATKTLPAGGTQVLKYQNGNFVEFFQVPQEDMLTFGFVGTAPEERTVYVIDSRERNTAGLFTMNLETQEKQLIFEDARSDIQGATVHPTQNHIQAVRSNYLKAEWHVIDPDVQEDFDYLATVKEGDFTINSRSQDDQQWIVGYNVSNEAYKYYYYDRQERKATMLFSNRPELDEYTLAKMYALEIPSRDGLNLVSYLTLPADLNEDGRPIRALPMVLVVHGGPWARDRFGFNGLHQWLANRGYAVLSVNFRGSTGFGKNFINAAIHEWGGKMHDDLIDAVDWAVKEGIAKEGQVAIMGGSYGGYATLAGLTFTPEKFVCGVDIVGPSNLQTLLSTIPPYWAAIRSIFVMHMGDPDTEEGRALLEERSPLNYVNHIKKPLLIAQGANDPRVKQSESDQIVEAMQAQNIPVIYVLYPDEGHGFARPENRLSFYAVTEHFFQEYLGGRVEPYGSDFENSSIEVITGASDIAGLEAQIDGEVVEEPTD